MNITPISLLGLVMLCWGLLVSILFWVPRLVNRPLLKQIYGPRFPIIYFIYISNGPFLVLVGLYLLFLN
ncbi:MAG: hypothetical protein ABFR97_05400 [Thermodesulfobacteriota bacterium]